MKRLSWQISLALVLGLGACAKKAIQEPSNPTGNIVGRVTDLRTGAPVAGVTVSTIVIDEREGLPVALVATTDASGLYALIELPAGVTYAVRFEKGGFVPRFAAATLPDAAGDFPQGNSIVEVNEAIAGADAGVTGKVFGPNGDPIVGAIVGVDLRGAGFDLVQSATTDATGFFTFSGLPGSPTGLPITLVVQPFDQDADGRPDFDTLAVNALTFPSAVSRVDVDLRTAAAAIVLLASDVDDGDQPADQPIELTFNRAVDLTGTTITLLNIDTNRNVAVNPTLDATGAVMTLTPAGGTDLAPGDTFSLTVNVRATNGDTANFVRLFTTLGVAPVLPDVQNLSVEPSDVDFDTRTFALSWDSVAGAAAYRIFVRDNNFNPSYLQVAQVGNSPAPSASITLPGTFDFFSGDGIQTPFAFDVDVDFAVVGVDINGDSADPAQAATVSHSDNIAPSLSSQQLGDADNSTNPFPVTLSLNVFFSEYIDPASAVQIVLPSAGMTATFELDPGLLRGTFTITIPPNLDGSGFFSITGAVDTSGNTMFPFDGVLNGTTELVANGGFEANGGGCTLSGWSTAITGTASTPIATSARAASGACSAQIGNQTINGIQGGTSTISQVINLPNNVNSIVATVTLASYTTQIGHDPNTCRIRSLGGTVLATLAQDSTNNNFFNTTVTDISFLAGSGSVRLECGSSQDGNHTSGGFVDNVSVLVNP
jgi:hypothetical protein